jgi:hypothetical protein
VKDRLRLHRLDLGLRDGPADPRYRQTDAVLGFRRRSTSARPLPDDLQAAAALARLG